MAFALGALLLSVLLAGTTFALTRANLSNQRESTALSRVYVDANVVRDGLLQRRDTEHIQDQFLPSLQLPTGSRPLLHYRDRWFFSVTASVKDESVIPVS